MCWYKKSILKIKKILSQYIFKKIYFKNNHYVIINIIARILVCVSQWVNNNFLFKCKDVWVGLKVRNVFASSLSSNKVFSTVAPWIVHSRAAPNILATNFIPFNFFPFKIFPILIFFLFNFFYFSLMIFFSYYKEKINLYDLFYIVQKLGDDIFFFIISGWVEFPY